MTIDGGWLMGSKIIFSRNLLSNFLSFFFFFNDTATTEIYTLSLHDALPISHPPELEIVGVRTSWAKPMKWRRKNVGDRR